MHWTVGGSKDVLEEHPANQAFCPFEISGPCFLSSCISHISDKSVNKNLFPHMQIMLADQPDTEWFIVGEDLQQEVEFLAHFSRCSTLTADKQKIATHNAALVILNLRKHPVKHTHLVAFARSWRGGVTVCGTETQFTLTGGGSTRIECRSECSFTFFF